jgi:hypothetical protein
MAVSFIGGGNRSTQRKTMDLSQITDKLYHITYQKYGKRFYHGKHEDFEIESLVALTST